MLVAIYDNYIIIYVDAYRIASGFFEGENFFEPVAMAAYIFIKSYSPNVCQHFYDYCKCS